MNKYIRVNEKVRRELGIIKEKKGFRTMNDCIQYLIDCYNKN